MRRLASLLAISLVVLTVRTSAHGQVAPAAPAALSSAIERAKIPEGYGIAFTWRERVSWDAHGAMTECGDASFRFDPRVRPEGRFSDVRLEGNGECQRSVVDEARNLMRHGRPDIELAEHPQYLFSGPYAVVENSPTEVTYEAAKTANLAWSGRYGEEAEPRTLLQQQRALGLLQQMQTRLTVDKAEGRISRQREYADELRLTNVVVRNAEITTTFSVVGGRATFPSASVTTGLNAIGPVRVQSISEARFSDVQLVPLGGNTAPAPGSQGPRPYVQHHLRFGDPVQPNALDFVLLQRIDRLEARLAAQVSNLEFNDDPPSGLGSQFFDLGRAYLQLWGSQIDRADARQSQTLRGAIQAFENSARYRSAAELVSDPSEISGLQAVLAGEYLVLDDEQRAYDWASSTLKRSVALHALAQSSRTGDEAAAVATSQAAWVAAQDLSKANGIVALISRSRQAMIGTAFGTSDWSANPDVVGSKDRLESLRAEIVSRNRRDRGLLRQDYISAFDHLAATLAPDLSDQRLAQVMQQSGADAIAVSMFGATAPAASTIVIARTRAGALRRAGAVAPGFSRDDPLRLILFGRALNREERMERFELPMQSGRGRGAPIEGWIGTLTGMQSGPSDQAAFRRELSTLGTSMWAATGRELSGALDRAGVRRGARIVWIPSGALSFLPILLAQDPQTGERLIDRYELVIVPSIDLLSDRSLVPTSDLRVAGIFNPTGDLPFAEVERSLVEGVVPVAGLDGDYSSLTSDQLLEVFRGFSVWHFAAHGSFNWETPRDSGIQVSQGTRRKEGIRLTVSDLVSRTRDYSPRLVVLSACDTGIVGLNGNPDTFIGLPTALLAAGADGVVATLWPVDDLATSLLMGKFYRLMVNERVSPPTALRRAQIWLRDSTQADLLAFMAVENFGGEQAQRMAETARAALLANGRERPFQEPYYWGAFAFFGR